MTRPRRPSPAASRQPPLHGTTVFSGPFAANKFTNSLAAPGTPLGSCRKNASVVYTYVPAPYFATRIPPSLGDSPGSFVETTPAYSPACVRGMYRLRSWIHPAKSDSLMAFGYV